MLLMPDLSFVRFEARHTGVPTAGRGEGTIAERRGLPGAQSCRPRGQPRSGSESQAGRWERAPGPESRAESARAPFTSAGAEHTFGAQSGPSPASSLNPPRVEGAPGSGCSALRKASTGSLTWASGHTTLAPGQASEVRGGMVAENGDQNPGGPS